MMRRALTLFLAALFLASAAWPNDEARRLWALFDREWETRLEEDPLFATSVGRHEWNDRLPSMRPADLERRRAAWSGFLDDLDGIDVETRTDYYYYAGVYTAEDELADPTANTMRRELYAEHDRRLRSLLPELPSLLAFASATDAEVLAVSVDPEWAPVRTVILSSLAAAPSGPPPSRSQHANRQTARALRHSDTDRGDVRRILVRTMSQMRLNPLNGRWVTIVAARAERPSDFAPRDHPIEADPGRPCP